MSSIEIRDATVSYLIRQARPTGGSLSRAFVGGKISQTRRYVEITALEGVSLTFRDGDRVGFIGANGSGKTTLLKLCAGALAVKAGHVKVTGKVTPQFSMMSGIRSELSGRLNAELKSLYLNVPQRQIPEKIEQIRELSGLGGYFELPVSSYSAGMRSRLVIAMMTLVRAEILVMDEWIGAADATLIGKTSTLQSELIERTSIMLMASHSQAILKEWANELVWLDQGRIVQSGPVHEVLARYNEWTGKQ